MHKTIRMQDITPKLASEMLETMKYERQRTLRPDHVKYLANEMRAKRFSSNTIGVCEMPGGTQFMVNGYHTLYAIIDSGCTQTLPIEFFHVKSYQEVDKVYAHFDRQLKRTRLDTIRVYGLEESFGIPASPLNKFAAACVVVMKDFSSGGGLSYVPDDEVVLFMMDWLPACKTYLDAVKEAPITQTMYSRHLFPLGLVTCRYSSKAPDFWNKVATNDGLVVGDPRKTLHDWILSTSLTSDSAKKHHVTLPLGMRSVASAWNAYIDGRTLNFIRVMNTTLPIVIRETPYDARWKGKL